MYSIKVITPGAAVVAATELKAHARINTTALDSLLDTYIQAATDEFQERTGRAVSPTVFRQQLSSFGPCYLMTADVTAIGKIAYYDPDDVEQLETVSDWTFDGETVPCPLYRQDGAYAAANDAREYPAYVEFTAGWATCPGRVKAAILLLATHFAKNPQAVVNGSMSELPLGFLDCCNLYDTGIYGQWGN